MLEARRPVDGTLTHSVGTHTWRAIRNSTNIPHRVVKAAKHTGHFSPPFITLCPRTSSLTRDRGLSLSLRHQFRITQSSAVRSIREFDLELFTSHFPKDRLQETHSLTRPDAELSFNNGGSKSKRKRRQPDRAIVEHHGRIEISLIDEVCPKRAN